MNKGILKNYFLLFILVLLFNLFVLSSRGNFTLYPSSINNLNANERFSEVIVTEFEFNGTGQSYETGTGTFFHVLGRFEIWNNNNFVVNRTFMEGCGFYLESNELNPWILEPDFDRSFCENSGDIEFYNPGLSEQWFSGWLMFDNLALASRPPNGVYEFTISGTNFEVIRYNFTMNVNSDNIVLMTGPIPSNWGDKNVVPSTSFMTQVWSIDPEVAITSIFSTTSSSTFTETPIILMGLGVFVVLAIFLFFKGRSRTNYSQKTPELAEIPSEKYYENIQDTSQFCQSCGTLNEKSDQFCSNCGTRVS